MRILLLFVAWILAGEARAWDDPWRGVWHGETVYVGQGVGDREAFRTAIVLRADGSALIDYPTYGCGGRLEPRAAAGDVERSFVERLEYGETKCADGGLVTLRREGQTLVYRWAEPARPEVALASGRLEGWTTGAKPTACEDCANAAERDYAACAAGPDDAIAACVRAAGEARVACERICPRKSAGAPPGGRQR